MCIDMMITTLWIDDHFMTPGWWAKINNFFCKSYKLFVWNTCLHINQTTVLDNFFTNRLQIVVVVNNLSLQATCLQILQIIVIKTVLLSVNLDLFCKLYLLVFVPDNCVQIVVSADLFANFANCLLYFVLMRTAVFVELQFWTLKEFDASLFCYIQELFISYPEKYLICMDHHFYIRQSSESVSNLFQFDFPQMHFFFSKAWDMAVLGGYPFCNNLSENVVEDFLHTSSWLPGGESWRLWGPGLWFIFLLNLWWHIIRERVFTSEK